MDVDRENVRLSRGIHLMTSSERPPEAIAVNESEVLKTQWDIIKFWEPASQLWPFRIGPWLIGTASGVTGILALNSIRRLLHLKEAARFTVLAGTVPVPAVVTVLLNTTLVTESIMLQKTQCPVCLELRAAAIQLGTGFVQPVGLAVFSSVMVANAKKIYDLPPWHQPLAVIRELRKLMQPMSGLLTVLVTVNLLTAFNVARFQMEKMPLILDKLKRTGMLKMHITDRK